MEYKYTMEVTKDKAIRILIYAGKTYTETWVVERYGYGTTGTCIEKQLEHDGVEISYKLWDALDSRGPTSMLEALISEGVNRLWT